jgi:cell division protein FtsZ
MARRKRASMREGPLADLFRSTSRQGGDKPQSGEQPTEQQPASGPAEDEPEDLGDREEASQPALPERPVPVARESEAQPPDPERVRAYRVEETAPSLPEPKERLSKIFADEAMDVEGPTYGRDEPGPGDYHGPPRPHLPVIRVVGVGGAGVNAINRMIEARIPGVEFMAINTDLQSLQQSTADVTVHLGSGVARGLGT